MAAYLGYTLQMKTLFEDAIANTAKVRCKGAHTLLAL